MTRRIVVISAGLGVPSSTRILADQLGAATAGALRHQGESVQVDVVELRGLAHALADNLLTGFPSGALSEAIELVGRADALIAVTPVFSASYTGLFKTFFDVLEPGLLEGMPVIVAATAGTARHSLVLDHALRPLFAYLKAVVVPTGVFAASEDFGDTRSGALQTRIERAASEAAALLTRSPAASRRTPASGAFDPEQPDFVSFEDLLSGP